MSTLRSLLVGIGAAVAAFVVSAIVLAILDLYLSGHNLPSPMKRSFISRGSVQLSMADAIALGVSAIVGVVAMAAHARRR